MEFGELNGRTFWERQKQQVQVLAAEFRQKKQKDKRENKREIIVSSSSSRRRTIINCTSSW